jgi:uncharacterized membrane protein
VRRSKLAAAVFLAAAVACAGQALYFAPILPAQVASHFGPSGAPNSWMPKELFIKLNLGAAALLSLMFLLLIPLKFRSLDASRIRLPNKDYWMAPARRGETADFLREAMLWFGAATMFLMLDVFHQVYRFNLGLSKQLEHPLASLGAYVAFTVVWMSVFFRRFSAAPPR